MKEQIAVFPGSFDPVTSGHVEIIKRAAPLFGKIIVAIGANSQKKILFPLDTRLNWLREIFTDSPNIIIDSYEGLTINFCKIKEANFILRGLRNTADFEYEKTIALNNRSIARNIETILMMASPEYAFIHSTIVRELIQHGADVKHLVPACVIQYLNKKP